MEGRSFRILQYNVRKEKDRVQAHLLEQPEVQDIDVIAIQEPWINSVTKEIYAPAHCKFHGITCGEGGARVAFYVNKRAEPSNWRVE